MDLLRILVSRSKPYAGYVLAVVVLQAITTAATLYLPSLNADIIDQGVSQGDIDHIWSVGRVMLGVAFIQVISAIAAVWFGSRTAMGLGRDVRKQVYRKVTAFSAEDMAKFGSATLITRSTNDVQQIQMVYMMILNFMVSVPIMCIGGIIMAQREDPGMSWLVWVSVVVLAVVIGVLIFRLMPLFTSMQDKIDNINGTLREQLAGIRVIRAFGRERFEKDRFTESNKDLTDVSLRIGYLFVLMTPLITLVLNGATAAVLWFGGERVDQGLVQVGSLTAFLQYLLQILVSVMMGTFMAMMLPRAIICARRVAEVLNHEPSIIEPTEPAVLGAPRGEVEFKGVSFSYPGADEPVLKDISFKAHPGTTTAIIGSTGSGKTTLISLIPRLYAPTSGEVLIDDTNVSDIARKDLVQRVSLVPQKPYLFSGTVASNLRMANPDATDEELWHALNIAQAKFVDDLDMPIAQGGTNVSGGQRQRLSIARTIVAQPKIYLFDDSFSALDVITDQLVREAMKSSISDATMIIVAQRVSSIMDADQIIVFDNGLVVGQGTHNELLENNTTYREIVESQVAHNE
ncbi:ABC transporter ATP-binding protein [Corynebacterium lubricantis]|uniref:ABC transporter ATP-binding protein n=1 Tax=Corynebacterium lubricantis TaxID=541095 RepID=UPI0003A68CE6|nr:ABC transporter ATP-binding protein [Corynebacterium lubricantis]